MGKRVIGREKQIKKDFFEYWARIKKEILKEISPHIILLFGSHVREFDIEESDIDILVVSTKFSETKHSDRKIWIRKLMGWDLPLHLLCYTPDEFKHALEENSFVRKIYKEGIVLYRKIEIEDEVKKENA